jgi:hypothetical protein
MITGKAAMSKCFSPNKTQERCANASQTIEQHQKEFLENTKKSFFFNTRIG